MGLLYTERAEPRGHRPAPHCTGRACAARGVSRRPGPRGSPARADGELPGTAAAAPEVDFAALSALVDHTGHSMSGKDLEGKSLLVYFGYTYCPDVCPVELQIMSGALSALGAAAESIEPVFVTVDPERDTVEVLSGYVSHFDERLRGLTGTRGQVAAAARAFGVHYFKVFPLPLLDDEEDEEGDAEDENARYTMSHSASTYFVGADRRLLATFPYGTSQQEMASEIRRLTGQ